MISDSPFSVRNFHIEEFLTKMAVRTARAAKNPAEFRETAKNTQCVAAVSGKMADPMEVAEYVYN